jgi:hypothetical protein
MASTVTMVRAVAQSVVNASGYHVSSAALTVSPTAAAVPIRGLRASPIAPSSFLSGSLALKSVPSTKPISVRAQSSGRVVASTNGTGAPSGLPIDLRGQLVLITSFPCKACPQVTNGSMVQFYRDCLIVYLRLVYFIKFNAHWTSRGPKIFSSARR